MDANEKTAKFIAEARWDKLPAAVQDKARFCLIDNLGATLAGTPTQISRICTEYAAVTWPGDKSTILIHGQRSSAVGTAFANAAAANGLDTDDSARYAWGHAGAQIFPVALALTEALNLDGKRLLAAMVAGYEVAHRVGRCWHDDHEVYQACGSWGSVACAAVAANLMDLTAEQTWHAIGIADFHAPNLPMMRDIDNPAMVKHGIPWAAMTGVVSAELSSRGFTGIPSILGAEKYREWAEDIGENYLMVDGVVWKKKGYACCGWAHAAVEGAHELVKNNQIALETIDRIIVEAFHETARLGTKLPRTTEQAQFNLAWPVAAMLVDGEVGPLQTLEERLKDKQIQNLAGKIEIIESEELNELCRLHALGDPKGCFASKVTIKLKDGKTFNSGLKDGGFSYGGPGWSRETMDEKFKWQTNHVLETSKIEKLLDIGWHFDEFDSAKALIDLVR